MSKYLIMLVLLLIPIAGQATDQNRVRKYLADRGVSNAVANVDFVLRNDQDGRGWYIDTWLYPEISKPTLAQCPSDAESDAWVEMMDQYNKPVVLKVVENRFLNMCDTLTGGTNHVRLGFAELGVIIEGMTNQNELVMCALQLLTIDAQAKREGGLLWWDTCTWHPEVVGYMLPRTAPTHAKLNAIRRQRTADAIKPLKKKKK